MGFSGKMPKSEFRPCGRAKSELRTRWQSEVGIPTSGVAGSAGWLVVRPGGGFYAGQVARQGGGFNARQVARPGFNARQVARSGGGFYAGQVARQGQCQAGGAAGLQCQAGGADGWRLLCRAGGAPGWGFYARQVARPGGLAILEAILNHQRNM